MSYPIPKSIPIKSTTEMYKAPVTKKNQPKPKMQLGPNKGSTVHAFNDLARARVERQMINNTGPAREKLTRTQLIHSAINGYNPSEGKSQAYKDTVTLLNSMFSKMKYDNNLNMDKLIDKVQTEADKYEKEHGVDDYSLLALRDYLKETRLRSCGNYCNSVRGRLSSYRKHKNIGTGPVYNAMKKLGKMASQGMHLQTMLDYVKSERKFIDKQLEKTQEGSPEAKLLNEQYEQLWDLGKELGKLNTSRIGPKTMLYSGGRLPPKDEDKWLIYK